MENTSEKTRRPPERVPLFGSWQNAYLAVVAVFVVEVALFYALSRFLA